MLNQTQIYELFNEIDRLPGIMEPRIGRWRAWPMAKMQLVWQLMNAPAQVKTGRSRWWLRDLPRRASRYAAAWPRVSMQRKADSSRGAIGMLYVPRIHRCVDGRCRDFIFGDLLTGAGLRLPVVALRHPLVGDRSAPMPRTPTIDLAPWHAAAEQMALLLMGDPRLRRSAAELNRRIETTSIPLDRRTRGRKILLALALFEAKRRLFRQLFTWLGLRGLVVSYAPGRHGEIAAARELGLPVIELQHGVISAHCPDYAWPPELAACKDAMPLPVRIAVFGPKFRDLLLRSGFWRPDEVAAAGSAAMEAHRPAAPPAARAPGPLRLVFMTQATTRTAAIAFWRRFATRSDPIAGDCQVVFKLHPEEAAQVETYRALAQAAPDRFSVADEGANPIEAMLAADIVVSYNSLALIEALGLGQAAVSLCGGTIPDGFAGTFGMPDVARAMPHVASPAALASLIAERAAGDGKLVEWQREALGAGEAYFCDGFSANVVALINGSLGPDHGSAVARVASGRARAASLTTAN